MRWLPPAARESRGFIARCVGTEGSSILPVPPGLISTSPGSVRTYSLWTDRPLSAKPSGTMETSVVFIDSEKGASLVGRGLTSPSFFACQGGTVAAPMNPKEEEVTIITEVSPRGQGTPVTRAGEGGTQLRGRQVSLTCCTQHYSWCSSAGHRRRRGRGRKPQGPLLSAPDTARSARHES